MKTEAHYANHLLNAAEYVNGGGSRKDFTELLELDNINDLMEDLIALRASEVAKTPLPSKEALIEDEDYFQLAVLWKIKNPKITFNKILQRIKKLQIKADDY